MKTLRLTVDVILFSFKFNYLFIIIFYYSRLRDLCISVRKCPFQSIAAKPENKSKVASLGNPQQLIKYLDRTYHACKNVYFLQGLFLASEAPELYEICLNYAKTRATKMIFFERQILETG